jgi:5-methylcytosine-specific restriction enzyme subunit McrC
MFNMNLLWEKFVYTSLRKNKQGDTIIKAQNTKKFWAPEKGSLATIRPDIVIVADTGACVVLDTKWKNIKGANPSPDDLRQMYVYMNYYNADKVALLYPGSKSRVLSGNYYDETTAALKDKGCSIILLEMNENIALWQRSIYSEISKWMGRK